jgi:zinc protease
VTYPIRRLAAIALLATAPFAVPGFSAPGFLPSFAFTGAAFAAAEIAPAAESFMLDNGLQVVVIPDRRAPVVTHMVWYKVGSADERPGESGIAHFLEHLMFKGTKSHPEGAFSKAVADVGGEENAFTSNDYTAYFQRVSKDQLPLVMGYEADRMANLVLTDEQVLPERQVVLEERSSRTDSEPSAQLGEALDAALWVNHPYGVPVIGWRSEIEQLDRADAIAFYDRYYTPNNAVLVVAGDVDAAEVRRLALETYGKVARRAEPGPRNRPQVQELPAQRVVTLADENVAQPSTRIAWVAPSYTTGKPGEAEALEVLSEVLGGGSTSRLYRQLVRDDGPAVSAGAYYRGSNLDDGEVMLYGVPRDGLTVEALEARLLAVLADVAANGVTDEELARAKRSIIADAVYAQDSQSTLARIFGVALTTGGTVEDAKTWPSRIEGVSAAAVKAAAQRLDPNRAVVGRLLPKAAATAVGGAGEAPAAPPAAAPATTPSKS